MCRFIPREQLKTKPFFKPVPAELFSEDEESAKKYARKHYYEILARGIPARTFAVAANKVDENVFESFDMPNSLRNDWYTSEVHWGHSSFKNAAYLYTYPVYKTIVKKGALK